MQKIFFNSRLENKLYKKIKIEAVSKGITIKEHIANILTNYVKSNYPEICNDEENTINSK